MGKNTRVHPNLILLLLVFLPADASVSGKPQYMVLVPSLLHSETPEKGCLLLSYLNETVTVSASLESLRENKSLFTDLVVEKDLFHCVSFTVSMPVMFLTIQVKGPTQEFKRRTTVVVRNKENLVFVQTDKPIYKPGQTVKFRVVALDENFHPLNELDPKGNRIAQWQKLLLENGLKQLSFPLSSEPFQGSYEVVVQKESGGVTMHDFTVEEFVLPKFEVQITMPRIITILEEDVNVSVCGLYTYGKPVPGHMTMRVCRKYNSPSNCYSGESRAVCEKFSHQVGEKLQGCVSQQVKTKIFQMKRQGYEMRLEVEAKIQEEGTEVELTGKKSTEITTTITKLSFIKVDPYFRRGIPFFGQVQLMDGKGVPMPNELVFITANEADYNSNATTDEHGMVQFSINTTNIMGTSLTVRHKDHSPCYGYQWLLAEYKEAAHTADLVFSPSKSFVHLEPMPGELPCGQTRTVRAHYILNGRNLQELKELVFYYLIMAKGGIVRNGMHVLPVEQGNMNGHFSVSVPVETDIAPIARLLFFTILPDGEVVGDSAKYEVENCLANKVDLSFRPAQSLPASHAHLRVSASPQSLCALRAVDQSVLLMKPETELSAASVSSRQPWGSGKATQGTQSKEKCLPDKYITSSKKLSPITQASSPGFCLFHHPICFFCSVYYNLFICVFIISVSSPPTIVVSELQKSNDFEEMALVSEAPPETVRKYFPETWIWDLVVLDSSGVAEVGVTVPDTITEWKAGAFCLSNDTGLGLSLPASFRAFQPFFVELTMPYSVIRGEAFTLKATVLNYLPKCIQVIVQLHLNPAFLVQEKEQESHCICGNGRQTVSWAVRPKALGNVNFTVSAQILESQELCGTEVVAIPEYGKKDTIIKSLLVEPEGLEMEATFNSLFITSHLSHSLGDILGSAMQNIQNLLQMPYGCGEQNMVLFAPNIHVLNYLNKTQQLTPEVMSKAIGYLNTGYQRQLNYRHHDGSFSTFGEKYGRNEGNTWLTAFVIKTFAQAQNYIFIENAYITQALIWLSQRQKDNGCFRSSGSLLNNAIKGGVEDEVTLSAYITIALLEIPLPATHPIVRNALFCLESAWKSAKEGPHGKHVYTKALLAYAFALAGNQERRREALSSLHQEAVKEESSVHWERPEKPRAPAGHFYEPPAPSAEVEMTSYVLLAYLTAQPAPTSEELTSASRIVKWIIKQQNSHGGFSSTQDTVVALQALSRYGAATFTRTGKPTQVTIQHSGTVVAKFQVDDDNRLLLQQTSLPELPKEYTMTVTGEGCVYLQTSLKYNILPEKAEFPFALDVQTLPQTCDGPKAHTSFQISLNVSYTGSRPASNMVIIDVKMVSGFIPLKPTVKMVGLASNHVNRTEVSNNHVLIYLDKVTNQTLSMSFTVLQDVPVRELKPAIVKVYDYYETDEFAIAEYDAPCSKGK
uniref:Alpha-2-macroglobulin n=1 Tax=Neovison vison TaxID=452646 RepID=A0A8C7EMF2_NEOVI